MNETISTTPNTTIETNQPSRRCEYLQGFTPIYTEVVIASDIKTINNDVQPSASVTQPVVISEPATSNVKKTKTEKTPLKRNMYNSISETVDRSILNAAILKSLLPAEFVDVDRKHRGSALNYSVYDYDKNSLLVQKRHTTCTKYGNSPQVDYFYLTKKYSTITIKELISEKLLIQRRAKAAMYPGDLIKSLGL